MNARMVIGMSMGVFAMSLPLLFWGGCERHADIRDERNDTPLGETPIIDAGELPLVDSGIETDAYLACADRPVGDCVGSNDFLCGFEKWMAATAKNCQTSTGCKTNGWLEVRMGFDGCVHEIRMDEPNDEMIACLVAEFGAVRCPCPEIVDTYYFGNTNTGVCPSP